MPLYKASVQDRDLPARRTHCIFEFDGIAVSFLFSKKSPQQNYVLTEVVVEAENLLAATALLLRT